MALFLALTTIVYVTAMCKSRRKYSDFHSAWTAVQRKTPPKRGPRVMAWRGRDSNPRSSSLTVPLPRQDGRLRPLGYPSLRDTHRQYSISAMTGPLTRDDA